MYRRIGSAFLCLLALPLLAAAQSTPPASILPGLVRIDLDPRAVSFLPIHTEALTDGLCDGTLGVSYQGTLSPRGECDVSVSTPTNMDLYTLGNVTAGGTQRVGVQPAGPATWYASAPVATPCGLWTVSMIFNPKTQPVSSLDLEPSALGTSGTNPAQGVFAGVLKIAVLYRFVNPDKGITLELPAVVPLELSGHWAAAPNIPGVSLGDGVSNLLLFAGVAGGEWSIAPACGTWADSSCPVCAVSPAPPLALLNQCLQP
jgi:hypothetical protein